MKIYINNRNYLTWPKAMAEKFATEGHEVIFIDNGSTYEPLLEWYDKKEFPTIKLSNVGATAAWTAGVVTDLNEYYVVTDPDYDLSMILSDWDKVLLEGFTQFPLINKFGFSWDESKVPPENPAWILDKMNLYPEGNPVAWGSIGGNWHSYPCDTSFAIYRPKVPFRIEGIRKGRPYTGMHLPWHVTLDPTTAPGKVSIPMDDEIEFYFDHVENSSCSYGRMLPMLQEYKLRKQGKQSV
jgi:glycosyltransferase involved in cell wall biosynthesis